jgi:hypothetical protein
VGCAERLGDPEGEVEDPADGWECTGTVSSSPNNMEMASLSPNNMKMIPQKRESNRIPPT